MLHYTLTVGPHGLQAISGGWPLKIPPERRLTRNLPPRQNRKHSSVMERICPCCTWPSLYLLSFKKKRRKKEKVKERKEKSNRIERSHLTKLQRWPPVNRAGKEASCP